MEAKFKEGDKVKTNRLGEEYIFIIEACCPGPRGYSYYDNIGLYREHELTLVCRAENQEEGYTDDWWCNKCDYGPMSDADDFCPKCGHPWNKT